MVKDGFSRHGLRRHLCRSCGRRFTVLTNTIFDSHKLPVSQWIGFLLGILDFSSFSLASKVNRNSSNTASYWFDKTMLLLEGVQDDIVHRPDGREPRGLSGNQLCIGIACDREHAVFLYEGTGKTSGRRTLEASRNHIRQGSNLIHDMEHSHGLLVKTLGLTSETYDSKEIKRLPDKKNHLFRVNEQRRPLKMFLNAHPEFIRRDIQGYLNMFSVIVNAPGNKYEKVEKILDLGIAKPILLRYRDEKPQITH